MCVFLLLRRTRGSPLFPYTTLFRSLLASCSSASGAAPSTVASAPAFSAASRLRASISTTMAPLPPIAFRSDSAIRPRRSEEHTSELQSHHDLVCRLLLEKKNFKIYY